MFRRLQEILQPRNEKLRHRPTAVEAQQKRSYNTDQHENDHRGGQALARIMTLLRLDLVFLHEAAHFFQQRRQFLRQWAVLQFNRGVFAEIGAKAQHPRTDLFIFRPIRPKPLELLPFGLRHDDRGIGRLELLDLLIELGDRVAPLFHGRGVTRQDMPGHQGAHPLGHSLQFPELFEGKHVDREDGFDLAAHLHQAADRHEATNDQERQDHSRVEQELRPR